MSHLAWYVARSAGLVGWGLLAVSVLLGVLLAPPRLTRRLDAAWLRDLHPYVSGMAVVFVVVHVVAVIADSYTSFGLADVLVPLASSWHPVGVAWGVIGMYLLVAIELTSLAKHRLPARTWRLVHQASYPVFLLSTVHLMVTGTDAATRPTKVLVLVTSAAILGLTARALVKLSEHRPAPRRPADRHVPRTVRYPNDPWPTSPPISSTPYEPSPGWRVSSNAPARD